MPNPTAQRCGLKWRYNATGNMGQKTFDTPFARALFIIMLSPYATVLEQW